MTSNCKRSTSTRAGPTSSYSRPCWRVEATSPRGARRWLYFALDDGRLAGRDGEAESLAIYGDYREFEGLWLPTVETYFVLDTGIEETWRIHAVDFPEPDPSRFARPEAIAELLRQRDAGEAEEAR